jgi:Ca2+-binding EF-hand superfamily protein
MYEAFNSIDLNNDGEVSASEIKRVVGSRGHYVSEKEAALLVKKFDTDHDSKIAIDEVRYFHKNKPSFYSSVKK